jgi:hypothetical protein
VPELTARKVSYLQPVSTVGTDAQGRTVVICPHCSDEAVIEADGRIVCPTGEAIDGILAGMLADLDEPTALPADSPLRGRS